MNKEENKKRRHWYEILDENELPTENVVAITTYKDGIVVATPTGLYTNVKSLIKKH